MNKILINFAHPVKERSKINNTLRDAVEGLESVENYISMYQKHNKNLEELFTLDLNSGIEEEIDKAWSAKNPEK